MLDLSGVWTLAESGGEPVDMTIPGHDADIAFTPTSGDPAAVRLTTRDLYTSFTPTS